MYLHMFLFCFQGEDPFSMKNILFLGLKLFLAIAGSGNSIDKSDSAGPIPVVSKFVFAFFSLFLCLFVYTILFLRKKMYHAVFRNKKSFVINSDYNSCSSPIHYSF